MLASIKQNFLIYTLNFLFATLSWIRDERVFKWSYSLIAWLAEKLVKKDYYVKKIRWIKDLFDSNHPSLTVTKKYYRVPTHTIERQLSKPLSSTIVWWEPIRERIFPKSTMDSTPRVSLLSAQL